MKNRNNELIALRPLLDLAFEPITAVEKFQNATLRPILKFQNAAFIKVFQKYIEKRKGDFYKMDIAAQYQFIEKAIKTDMVFKNLAIGMVVGLLTMEELIIYQTHESELNRRISTMLVQRLQSQIDFL